MKAQVIKKFGGPEVFEAIEIPKPLLKPRHVLIKVHATSVNPIDCKIRSGVVKNLAPTLPAILQGDVAGVVSEIADDVNEFKIGDEVFGCAGGFCGIPGALAEYMLADVNLIAKKPNSLSMLEAAALPLISITAWEALFQKTDINKFTDVLIHGGVGGVGHLAIQLAKTKGLKVITTVRKPEDFPLASVFGADEIINSENETVDQYKKRLTNDKGFDLIFDTVGGANLEKSFAAAAYNGTIVTTAARVIVDLTPMHSKGLSLNCVLMLQPFLTNQNKEIFATILKDIALLVEAGAIKPLIDPTLFDLDNIGAAHAHFESGKARGKVVITIN